MDENKNRRFYLDETGAVASTPASAEEIEEARGDFEMALRSCWNCNSAHEHFLNEPRGRSFLCFDCGRYFSNGIDVTDYEDAPTLPASETQE